MPPPADQPTQSAHADGSHNIIVQAVGDGITITVGRPHLTLIPPRNRLREIRTEIDLLNPYCRSIALVGREADIQSLWDWLHSPRPVAVRTLKGRAGAGKTRLAIELVERLNAEHPGKWWAGFVGGREMRRFAEEQNLADWGWARPTLVVVDYAASLVEPLREWLRDLAQNPARNGGIPLRLLLLEREGDAGQGWLEAVCSGGYSEAGVPELFDPLEPKLLDHLDTSAKRRAVLAGMLAAAANLTGRPVSRLPMAGQNQRLDKQLENTQWEDPLYLMMAALLSLQSDLLEILELPRTGLALRLVDHEIKRLSEGASSREAEKLLLHLTAFASLGNGLSHDQALTIAAEESAALLLAYPGGEGALVARVHEVLPAPDHGLAPVVPDILAEALVLRAFKECSVAQQNAAVLRAVKTLGHRVVPFILRTIQDFAPAGETAPMNWLEYLIKAGVADDLGLLAALEDAMPHQTLVLREKAAEVCEALVGRLARLTSAGSSEPIGAELARLRNNLSIRMSALGRREEALEQAQEAVRLYRQLAQARPDAFLPSLATSLNNLANRMSGLGRREEALEQAQEAVRIREQLAAARPDAFLPDLAESLNNLANCLSELGRRDEALEPAQAAVRLYGQLAAARPDAFLPDLAGSLNNLANHFSMLGRREEALEQAQAAVRLYGQLAAARPDAFLPDLAMSLNNLAGFLSALGRREDALEQVQEAVRIREQLAQARPDAFLPDLAGSCGVRGAVLQQMERPAEAVASFAQGIQALTPLFQKTPPAFAQLMAGLLNDYLQSCEQAQAEPDTALLAPVTAVFHKLQQNQPED